jgi:hypothetical protein
MEKNGEFEASASKSLRAEASDVEGRLTTASDGNIIVDQRELEEEDAELRLLWLLTKDAPSRCPYSMVKHGKM